MCMRLACMSCSYLLTLQSDHSRVEGDLSNALGTPTISRPVKKSEKELFLSPLVLQIKPRLEVCSHLSLANWWWPIHHTSCCGFQVLVLSLFCPSALEEMTGRDGDMSRLLLGECRGWLLSTFCAWVLGLCLLLASMNSIPSEGIVCVCMC